MISARWARAASATRAAGSPFRSCTNTSDAPAAAADTRALEQLSSLAFFGFNSRDDLDHVLAIGAVQEKSLVVHRYDEKGGAASLGERYRCIQRYPRRFRRITRDEHALIRHVILRSFT
jgi:hypothetical protein